MGKFVQLTKAEVEELETKWIGKRGDKASLLRNVAVLYLKTKLNEFFPTQFFAYNGNFRGEDAFILAKQSKQKYYNSYTWTICAPESKYMENDMFEALELIIDWTIHNCFTAVHIDIVTALSELCKKHGKLGEWGPNSVYRLNDQQINCELKTNDPSIEVTELDSHGIQLLIKHWPYEDEAIYDAVSNASTIAGSAGVRVNNEFVSWAFGAADGAIHGLFTLENHRGKGYGKIVLQALEKMLAKKGVIAITEVDDNNVASKKLMKNSGFDFLYTMMWLEFTPKQSDSVIYKHL